jgi:hypothetical protein
MKSETSKLNALSVFVVTVIVLGVAPVEVTEITPLAVEVALFVSLA